MRRDVVLDKHVWTLFFLFPFLTALIVSVVVALRSPPPSRAGSQPRVERPVPSTSKRGSVASARATDREELPPTSAPGRSSTTSTSATGLAPEYGPLYVFETVKRGEGLSAREARAIEERLKANPDDLESRILLVGFHSREEFDSSAANRHRLWIIEHRPAIAGDPDLRIHQVLAPVEYAEGKRLWLKHIKENPRDTVILENAAEFVMLAESELAEDFLRRAEALEPLNPEWPERIAFLYELRYKHRKDRERGELARKCLDLREQALRLSADERGRFRLLGDLAEAALDAGDLARAGGYATELLQKVDRRDLSFYYGNAIHDGNIVLGKIALRTGDVPSAKDHLLRAGRTPGSPTLNSFGPDMSLAQEMLAQGERQTVIEYLTLCEKFWKGERGRLSKWKQLVQEGKTPALDRHR